MTEVHMRITRYEYCCIPESDPDRDMFTITVEYRGDDRWAVLVRGRCLGADGSWGYEPLSSDREDDWLETHRFDLATAQKLAVEHAPKVMVNGVTAEQWLERYHRMTGGES